MNAVIPIRLDGATRQHLEDVIENLVALLDKLDGDPDLEPYLAGEYWGTGGDDREDENEHGGDVQDEPHDQIDEGSDEPLLGWSNPQWPLGTKRYIIEQGWACIDTA